MGSPVHQGGCCLTQPRHQAVDAAQPWHCGAHKQRSVTLGQQQGGEGFNVQPQAIEELVSLNERTQQAFRQGDFQAVRERTAAFYEALFRLAGMDMAWAVVQSLNARINRLRAMTIGSPGRQAEAAAEMARIIEALKKRDASAAQQASEDHLRGVAQIATDCLRGAS